MDVSTITPAALAELLSGSRQIDLIDVRTPAEYRALHVATARNVPLDRLDPTVVMQVRKGVAGEEPIYIICQAGGRGKQACERFCREGYSNVINIEGGTLACEKEGLPVIRGKEAMSLERQVRITAGSLVVLGAFLSWFVHPGFIALSAFVGAGLVFAGVTDTCGMGMLLARMPWNQCEKSGPKCSVH